MTNEDYEKILEVFPGMHSTSVPFTLASGLIPLGTNLNGVKIRTSRLRCERADIFAELGWDLPEGGKGGARRGPKGEVKGATDETKSPTKGRKRATKDAATEEKEKSKSVQHKHEERVKKMGKVESALEKQYEAGRVLAVISSRPGQSGRCDGYILEGEELAFYQRQTRK